MSEPGLSSGPGQHARDFESARVPGQGGRSAPLPAGPPAPLPLRWLGLAVDCGIVAIGATMITLVFMNVVLRVFSLDFAWVTELAELLMVWVTFLGGAAAARRGAHMTITEFVDKLGGRDRLIADGLIDVVAAVVLALLVIYGINLTLGKDLPSNSSKFSTIIKNKALTPNTKSIPPRICVSRQVKQ